MEAAKSRIFPSDLFNTLLTDLPYLVSMFGRSMGDHPFGSSSAEHVVSIKPYLPTIPQRRRQDHIYTKVSLGLCSCCFMNVKWSVRLHGLTRYATWDECGTIRYDIVLAWLTLLLYRYSPVSWQ